MTYKLDKSILKILLKDQTTKENIYWATSTYENYGEGYQAKDHIQLDQISGENEDFIVARVDKAKAEQLARTKQKAEVFTPSWVCNLMSNYLDEDFFGSKNIFNVEKDKSWKTNLKKIKFPKNKDWKDYVNSTVIEITCGEAPFLVSRYDTVTGEDISLNERIGLLDRKLRVVNENTDNHKDWLKWAENAYQSTYGYEYQGDNLFLARKNLLLTFIDYYKDRFNRCPNQNTLEKFADIISWNIWQMDGLTYEIPFSEHKLEGKTGKLFVTDTAIEKYKAKIKDWKENKELEFRELTN